MYSNDNKSENIGFETSPLLFRCLSVLLLITEMSAKDLAAAAVEKGMSIRGAAQVFGINFSTLQNLIAMQNRPSFTDAKQKEALIVAALESVAEKRLSVFSAAKLYGIAYGTLSGRTTRNRRAERGRPTKFSKDEEDILVDILIKLARLSVGLTKLALVQLLAKVGEYKGKN